MAICCIPTDAVGVVTIAQDYQGIIPESIAESGINPCDVETEEDRDEIGKKQLEQPASSGESTTFVKPSGSQPPAKEGCWNDTAEIVSSAYLYFFNVLFHVYPFVFCFLLSLTFFLLFFPPLFHYFPGFLFFLIVHTLLTLFLFAFIFEFQGLGTSD